MMRAIEEFHGVILFWNLWWFIDVIFIGDVDIRSGPMYQTMQCYWNEASEVTPTSSQCDRCSYTHDFKEKERSSEDGIWSWEDLY